MKSVSLEDLENILQTDLMKYIADNKIVGYVVKYYNISTSNYEYYDFSDNAISKKTLKVLQEKDELITPVKMTPSADGSLWVSEIDTLYSPKGLETKKEIERVLKPVMAVRLGYR